MELQILGFALRRNSWPKDSDNIPHFQFPKTQVAVLLPERNAVDLDTSRRVGSDKRRETLIETPVCLSFGSVLFKTLVRQQDTDGPLWHSIVPTTFTAQAPSWVSANGCDTMRDLNGFDPLNGSLSWNEHPKDWCGSHTCRCLWLTFEILGPSKIATQTEVARYCHQERESPMSRRNRSAGRLGRSKRRCLARYLGPAIDTRV